jgi:hypothetical protein
MFDVAGAVRFPGALVPVNVNAVVCKKEKTRRKRSRFVQT